MASFTGVGDNEVLSVPAKGEEVSVAISGTYDMTIALQRAVTPDKTAWQTLKTFDTANATEAHSFTTERTNEIFRLIVLVDTSGTATATITDSVKDTGVVKDADGTEVFAFDQDRITFNKAVRFRGAQIVNQPAPQTATDTATLTSAQMLGGILEATPTAAAAYTVLTGALLEAALPDDVAVNDSFDLSIINLGGTGDVITLTAASGITIVGDAVVGVVADVATGRMPSGTFRFRRTAADTFTCYRVY